jgi:hypothetical protein
MWPRNSSTALLCKVRETKITVYVTTLTQLHMSVASNWWMAANYGMGRIQKNMFMPYLVVLYEHLSESAEENHESSLVIRLPLREPNMQPSE